MDVNDLVARIKQLSTKDCLILKDKFCYNRISRNQKNLPVTEEGFFIVEGVEYKHLFEEKKGKTIVKNSEEFTYNFFYNVKNDTIFGFRKKNKESD